MILLLRLALVVAAVASWGWLAAAGRAPRELHTAALRLACTAGRVSA